VVRSGPVFCNCSFFSLFIPFFGIRYAILRLGKLRKLLHTKRIETFLTSNGHDATLKTPVILFCFITFKFKQTQLQHFVGTRKKNRKNGRITREKIYLQHVRASCHLARVLAERDPMVSIESLTRSEVLITVTIRLVRHQVERVSRKRERRHHSLPSSFYYLLLPSFPTSIY